MASISNANGCPHCTTPRTSLFWLVTWSTMLQMQMGQEVERSVCALASLCMIAGDEGCGAGFEST